MDEHDGRDLSLRIRTLIADMRAQWRELDRRIAAFDAEFVSWARENECAYGRMIMIPIREAILIVLTRIMQRRLADVAPTMLALMDLKQPREMTGNSLIRAHAARAAE